MRVHFAILLPIVLFGCQTFAQTPPLTKTNDLSKPGSTVAVGGLTIHGGDSKFIEASGKVCLTDGILEFVAVETAGRDYESLFTVTSKPSAMQFALLLVGCEPGPLPRLAKSGEKAGDRIRIEAEWQADGKPKRVPVEQLLVSRRTNKPAADIAWIFTGSYFAIDHEGHDLYQSDLEQAFVSLWWNRRVLINAAGDYGDPYLGEAQGFKVNTAAAPPLNTPVKLIFRKWVP